MELEISATTVLDAMTLDKPVMSASELCGMLLVDVRLMDSVSVL